MELSIPVTLSARPTSRRKKDWDTKQLLDELEYLWAGMTPEGLAFKFKADHDPTSDFPKDVQDALSANQPVQCVSVWEVYTNQYSRPQLGFRSLRDPKVFALAPASNGAKG